MMSLRFIAIVLRIYRGVNKVLYWGGAVAALLFLTPIGIKSSIDSERRREAVKQEQKRVRQG